MVRVWMSGGWGGGLYADIYSFGAVSNSSMSLTAVIAANNAAGRRLFRHSQLLDEPVIILRGCDMESACSKSFISVPVINCHDAEVYCCCS